MMEPIYEQHGDLQVNREGLEEVLAEQALSRMIELTQSIGGSESAARSAHRKFVESDGFRQMVDEQVRQLISAHREAVPEHLH